MEKDLDQLFAAPLAEFTSLRNILAARFKKAGHLAEAEHARSLTKPSVTAWAVNQVYYKHPEALERLRVAGQRLREAQLSQIGGKPADVRSALEERRNALARLTGFALAMLESNGNAVTPEVTRRINATLEALSLSSSPSESERAGRLTQDLDPPGFDALAALMSGAAVSPRVQKRETHESTSGDSEIDSARKEAASALLRQAQAALAAGRTRVKTAEAGLVEAEELKRDADKELDKARSASDKANARLQERVREANDARRALQESEAAAARAVKDAKQE